MIIDLQIYGWVKRCQGYCNLNVSLTIWCPDGVGASRVEHRLALICDNLGPKCLHFEL